MLSTKILLSYQTLTIWLPLTRMSALQQRTYHNQRNITNMTYSNTATAWSQGITHERLGRAFNGDVASSARSMVTSANDAALSLSRDATLAFNASLSAACTMEIGDETWLYQQSWPCTCLSLYGVQMPKQQECYLSLICSLQHPHLICHFFITSLQLLQMFVHLSFLGSICSPKLLQQFIFKFQRSQLCSLQGVYSI